MSSAKYALQTIALLALLVFSCSVGAVSVDGTTAVPPSQITDDKGVVWSLTAPGQVVRNGKFKYSWTGKLLLWYGGTLYLDSLTDKWYALNRDTGSATLLPRDPRTGPVVVLPPPSGAVYVPPATSLTLPGAGTFTLSAGQVMLNGVGTGTSASLVELLNGTVYAQSGTTWSQWFQGSRYYGTGWAPISVWGNTDPAIYVQAPVPPYVGPSNTPDIWQVDMTSFAAVQARASYTLNAAYPANQEYLTDSNGLRYMRFSSNPDPAQWNQTYGQNGYTGDANILLTWFLGLGTPRSSANVGYAIYFEDDVAPAINTTGIKLPGLINQSASPTGDPDYPVRMYLRMFMRFPQSNTFSAADHIESIEMMPPQGNGQPIITDLGIQGGSNLHYKTNRWYWIEQGVVLNTPGVANGRLTYWINGNKIFERTDVNFRDRPDTLLRTFHVDVYHGGLDTPKGIMHMRLAKLAVSSGYIGVPAELLGAAQQPSTFPLWRRAMAKGVVAPIPNTANMAGNIPDSGPAVYPTSVGKNSYDINTFNGFAADATSFWGVAMGGHSGQWSNKVVRLDLSKDVPQWEMVFAGTNETNYTAVTGTALVPSAAAMDSVPYNYYFDGLPASRHTYFANHYIGKRSRVFMFYDGSSFGGISHPSELVDAFDIVAKKYDAAGTWASSGLFSGYGANARVPTCAKHPSTEDVYCSNNSVWKKWTQATGLWSDLAPTGLSYSFWQSNGSVIDGGRNLWVSFVGGKMQGINLTTLTTTSTAITGADTAGFVNDMTSADAGGANVGGTAVVHDLDGDRYLVFVGDYDDSKVYQPGKIYAVTPAGAVAKVADIAAPYNGWMSRVGYFQKLGGVAFQPDYASNMQFLATQ